MASLLLWLHIISALTLWGVSLGAFIASRDAAVSIFRMRNMRSTLIYVTAAVVLLGLLAAFMRGSGGLVSVCTRIGLYSSPALLSFISISRAIVKRGEVVDER